MAQGPDLDRGDVVAIAVGQDRAAGMADVCCSTTTSFASAEWMACRSRRAKASYSDRTVCRSRVLMDVASRHAARTW